MYAVNEYTEYIFKGTVLFSLNTTAQTGYTFAVLYGPLNSFMLTLCTVHAKLS
jgi:hypothetical protein